ncbi:MAG: transcription antitermination factor NusB, partial [Acidobacteriota bacterium]
AVWASTTLDVIPPFAALAKLGAAFAPLNAALTANEAVEMAKKFSGSEAPGFVNGILGAVDREMKAEAS